MKSYRLSRGETAHYSSFEELRAAYGFDPFVKQTKDKDKLTKQRERFNKRHLCSVCKQPLTHIGGNLLVCQNTECKGEKHEKKNDETGEIRIWYTPVYELLDEVGADIATNLFAEYEIAEATE